MYVIMTILMLNKGERIMSMKKCLILVLTMLLGVIQMSVSAEGNDGVVRTSSECASS